MKNWTHNRPNVAFSQDANSHDNDELIDKEVLSEDEQDYLNLLRTLVYEYEVQTVEIPDIYDI